MNKLYRNRFIALLIAIVLSAILILFLSKTKNSYYTISNNGFFFDTFITISITDNNPELKDKYENLLIEAIHMCKSYEDIFSYTLDSSELYQLNHSTSKNISLSTDMAKILELSNYYYELTNHSFNINMGELWELWDYTKQTIPSNASVNEALSKINNYAPTLLDNSLIYSDVSNKPYINLGGIAKGYIADILKEFLIDNGVSSAIINLGGNVLTIGESKTADNYKVAMTKPFSSGEISAYVCINDYSVVTSGIYERYFTYNDTIYHHIINPNDGLPVTNNLYSVTIISKSSTTADALSTGVFVLGIDKGMELINSLDDIYAIFIDNNYNIILSDGLELSNNMITIK